MSILVFSEKYKEKNLSAVVMINTLRAYPFLSEDPQMSNWLTVQTQIRCHRMQHLIRVCTVCITNRNFYSRRPRLPYITCLITRQVSNHFAFPFKRSNIDFQDDGHGGLLGFPIRTLVGIFDLQVTLILTMKFRVSWPFIKKKIEIGFQHGCHGGGQFGFLIGMILASFDLQVAQILHIKFQVTWSFGSGEEG